jgi:hypothetical protein
LSDATARSRETLAAAPWPTRLFAWFRRGACVAVNVLLAAGLCPVGTAWARSPTLEYQVKAAFILNFVTFTEWPETAFESPSSPLHICVVGDDPFDGSLVRTVQGESVSGHPLVTHRIGSSEELTRCHVLFVPRSAGSAGSALERENPAAPLLTVGESVGHGRDSAIINFAIDQGRVRFDVNRTAAERRGLRLSPKLLRIARLVRP